MSDKNYPTYRLRVSDELAQALKQAGPDKVRQILREHLEVHTPKEQDKVHTPIASIEEMPKAAPQAPAPSKYERAKAEAIKATLAKLDA